jgi:tripartite-type tricarboxylate transporter receptor subunit TctC
MKKYQWMKWLFITLSPLTIGVLAIAPSWAKYPDKPINFIMPWPAGGGTDISFRPLANAASKILGQPIAIEYHPGGSTAVGIGMLKIRKPDGYTIGQTSLSATISQHMRKVPYDLLKDFTLIMQYAAYTEGLVVMADSPWKTFKEFIEYAKANPMKIRYSSTGPGSPPSLVMAELGKTQNIKWTLIPFEGGPPALAALLGNHVEAYTTTMHCKPHITSGKLRLLATYGEKRIPSFPDVLTLQEFGLPIVSSNFMVILGPKGLPPEVSETLHQAFKKAMEDPEFIKGCGMVDHAMIYRDPKETIKHLQQRDAEIGALIRELNLQKK